MTISQNSNLEPNLSNWWGSKLSPKTSYWSTKSAQYRLKCKHGKSYKSYKFTLSKHTSLSVRCNPSKNERNLIWVTFYGIK